MAELKLRDMPIKVKYIGEDNENYTNTKEYEVHAVTQDKDENLCYVIIDDQGILVEEYTDNFKVVELISERYKT